MRKILGLVLVLLAGVVANAAAQMQAVCAAGKTGKAASITAKEAWDLANQRAKAWKPDAVSFELTTTSEGRSTRKASRRTGTSSSPRRARRP